MNKVYINGYFLNNKQSTGVQRFAVETLLSLDQYINHNVNDITIHFFVVVPRYTKINIIFTKIKIIYYGNSKHQHLWEQLQLPLCVRSNFLINLCNFAPLFKKNQLCIIHDLIIYHFPENYTRRFVIFSKMFLRLIVNNSRYLGTVSNACKVEMMQHFMISETQISVFNNSAKNFANYQVDTSILAQLNIKPYNYFLAVFSQSNCSYKNVTRFLQVARQLVQYQFVCVGKLNVRIDAPNIIFTNYISDNQLKTLYQNAQAFIFPSLYEGFGIPLLEAMMCNCPIIAADIPVVREICGEDGVVSVFNPLDTNDMSMTISKSANLIKNPAERDYIIKRYRQILNKYNWDNNAALIYQMSK
jgi:glycosyltransferase involved in cell wall biosynthesis